jgi:hypothetical protein
MTVGRPEKFPAVGAVVCPCPAFVEDSQQKLLMVGAASMRTFTTPEEIM